MTTTTLSRLANLFAHDWRIVDNGDGTALVDVSHEKWDVLLDSVTPEILDECEAIPTDGERYTRFCDLVPPV